MDVPAQRLPRDDTHTLHPAKKIALISGLNPQTRLPTFSNYFSDCSAPPNIEPEFFRKWQISIKPDSARVFFPTVALLRKQNGAESNLEKRAPVRSILSPLIDLIRACKSGKSERFSFEILGGFAYGAP